MSDSQHPHQPEQRGTTNPAPRQPEQRGTTNPAPGQSVTGPATGNTSADGGPPVDPQTGEDLSWKQVPLALVLLDRPAPDHREVGELLTEIFEGSYEVDPGTDDDPAAAVHVEDATVIVSTVDSPVPDGEASRYTADLAMWNGQEDVVDTHRSQVVVAAFRWGPPGDDDEPTAPEYMDPRLETLRCELAVANVSAALTALPGAVAVSMGGAATTLPAAGYRDLVVRNPLPAPALVGIRAGRQSESTSCVYTTGMGRFGQMDLERLDVPAAPAAAYGQMCDIVAFALANGTVFQPGQALGVGGPEPLITEVALSPFTGQEVLRLTPGAPIE